MDTTPSRKRAPPVAGTDLRDRILQTAIEMFATHGYGATSMRAVVEAVGCTKPALYYHFGSKAELFIEVHRTVQDLVHSVFAVLEESDGSLTERLERFVSTVLDTAAVSPMPTRLLLTAAQRPEQGQPEVDMESFHQANVVHLSKVLREGQSRGEVRTDLSAEELSDILLGIVHLRTLQQLRGKLPPPGTSQRIIDVFINGARP